MATPLQASPLKVRPIDVHVACYRPEIRPDTGTRHALLSALSKVDNVHQCANSLDLNRVSWSMSEIFRPTPGPVPVMIMVPLFRFVRWERKEMVGVMSKMISLF